MDKGAVALADADRMVGVWRGCAHVGGEGCGRLRRRDVGFGLGFGGVGEGNGRIANCHRCCGFDVGVGSLASGQKSKDEDKTKE